MLGSCCWEKECWGFSADVWPPLQHGFVLICPAAKRGKQEILFGSWRRPAALPYSSRNEEAPDSPSHCPSQACSQPSPGLPDVLAPIPAERLLLESCPYGLTCMTEAAHQFFRVPSPTCCPGTCKPWSPGLDLPPLGYSEKQLASPCALDFDGSSDSEHLPGTW